MLLPVLVGNNDFRVRKWMLKKKKGCKGRRDMWVGPPKWGSCCSCWHTVDKHNKEDRRATLREVNNKRRVKFGRGYRGQSSTNSFSSTLQNFFQPVQCTWTSIAGLFNTLLDSSTITTLVFFFIFRTRPFYLGVFSVTDDRVFRGGGCVRTVVTPLSLLTFFRRGDPSLFILSSLIYQFKFFLFREERN